MKNMFYQVRYSDNSVSNHEMVGTVETITARAAVRKSKGGSVAVLVKIEQRGLGKSITITF
jgi:hypothetical protein